MAKDTRNNIQFIAKLRILFLFFLILSACNKPNPQTKPKVKTIILAGINKRFAKRAKDNRAFIKRAKYLSEALFCNYDSISTGRELLNTLTKYSEIDEGLLHFILFSHGDYYGAFFNDSCGWYQDSVLNSHKLMKIYGGNTTQITTDSICKYIINNKIKFNSKSIICLLSCQSSGLAKELADKLKITTIGTTGFISPINQADSTRETGNYVTDGEFILYRNNQSSIRMGDFFDPFWFFKQPSFLQMQGVNYGKEWENI